MWFNKKKSILSTKSAVPDMIMRPLPQALFIPFCIDLHRPWIYPSEVVQILKVEKSFDKEEWVLCIGLKKKKPKIYKLKEFLEAYSPLPGTWNEDRYGMYSQRGE